MKVVVFRDLHEQQTGLRAWTAPYPDETIFFFPNVMGNVITTKGLGEAIKVSLLDDNLWPGSFEYVAPGMCCTLPRHIRNFIEFSVRSIEPWNRKELQQLLRAHA